MKPPQFRVLRESPHLPQRLQARDISFAEAVAIIEAPEYFRPAEGARWVFEGAHPRNSSLIIRVIVDQVEDGGIIVSAILEKRTRAERKRKQ